MNKITQDILTLTDQCVRCGLCMPHCPTNKLNNSEGYSPRGRIALWKNLAQGNLQLSPKTKDYLQSCLSCGTCDNNCPAGVKFSQLQNLGKSYLQQQSLELGAGSPLNRYIIKIFSSRPLTKSLYYALYLCQKLKLQKLLEFIAGLNLNLSDKFKKICKLYKTVPSLKLSSGYKKFYKGLDIQHSSAIQNSSYSKNNSSTKNKITDVIVFVGCVNDLAAQNKIKAAIKILTTLGINAHTSKKLHCCGALQKHNGYLEAYNTTKENNSHTAEKIIKNNKKISHLLTLDTGCHVSLVENFQALCSQGRSVVTSNFEDFLYALLLENEYLLQIIKSLNNTVHTDTIAQTILYYTPCSQREQLKQPNITKNLLELIFDKNQIIKVSEGLGCCGAAGTYMFTQQSIAEELASRIIIDLPADVLNNDISICTTNSGCALHLNTVLREKFDISTTIFSSLELIAGFGKCA